MLSIISAVLFALATMLGPSVVLAQTKLTSGFYTMNAISVAGFPIGPIVGPYAGVEPYQSSSPSYTWVVIEYPQGYVLHLAAGNAAAGSASVRLVSTFPGTFWNISEAFWQGTYTGLYLIQSPDGQSGWILPHGAPPGTAVSLGSRTPSDPVIPAEFFIFNSVI